MAAIGRFSTMTGRHKHALGAQLGEQRRVAPFIVLIQVGDQDRLPILQDAAQGIALAKQRLGVRGARDAAQDMEQARAVRRILRNQGDRHGQLGQRLAAQGQQGGGSIQLAADRFGDGQACAHALRAAVQILQRDGLLKVLVEEQRQIVLRDAEKLLLALQAGG